MNVVIFDESPQARTSCCGSMGQSLLLLGVLSMILDASSAQEPSLNGQHFRITAVQEPGFLDITTDDNGKVEYSGYLIDMLEGLAKPQRADFTYTLLPPSGFGSNCNPQISTPEEAYKPAYRTQYNCGTNDVNQVSDPTDMYLGMYYVTPCRQLADRFTIPFLPPSSGTLAMFGTATGIADFEDLARQQAEGLQQKACAPGGTALIDFVETAYPGLRVKGIFGGEDEIFQAFDDGTCDIYIVDGPVAAQAVLRYSRGGRCNANGKPIGVIGHPMEFGLSHYAIGIRKDINPQVEETLSYWLNILMSCSPLDPDGPCPDGNLATFYKGQGGTGAECSYVQFPEEPVELSPLAIAGIAIAWVALFFSFCFLAYWIRLRRQVRLASKRTTAQQEQAERERRYSEWITQEVCKPLNEAKASLGVLSTKATTPTFVPSTMKQDSIMMDVKAVYDSLECVSALLASLVAEKAPEAPEQVKTLFSFNHP